MHATSKITLIRDQIDGVIILIQKNSLFNDQSTHKISAIHCNSNHHVIFRGEDNDFKTCTEIVYLLILIKQIIKILIRIK